MKKAAANANYADKRLGEDQHRLIIEACDEILGGQHQDMFPIPEVKDLRDAISR